MVRRLTVLFAAVVALTALATVPAQGAKKKAPSKTVGVIDYAFTPAKLTVRPGTKIVWKWDKANSAPHDVSLKKGPKGVKRFTSPVYTAGISWSRTLTRRGAYSLVCTYHVNMKQTITVK